MRKKQVIKEENWYSLLCDCGEGKDRFMVCGIYPTKKEVIKANKEVKKCLAKHYIKKCKIEINI